MKYKGIAEEELKARVGRDWFARFDYSVITGQIDFSLYPRRGAPGERAPLLWAEAKTGDCCLADAFAQLVLTLGRARPFARMLPPAWLGAFDGRKIAFAPWSAVADLFALNDFNWQVAPSDRATREFQLVRRRLAARPAPATFDYEADAEALRAFIAGPLAEAAAGARIPIGRNNFYPIYLRWLDAVRPAIAVDWAALRAAGILDSDFYLADLFVDDKDTASIADDEAVRAGLFVTYEAEGYRIAKESLRSLFDAIIAIRDKAAYQAFWARYKRPPLAECQEWIIARRDLLVPQDIRERKGAFFTPRRWVELSQSYLAAALGEAWQEEYYVWDCAAGTGNLLAGLTNRYRIFASTLDMADVDAMRERAARGANLLPAYLFQFDFLNDPFVPQSQGGKLPDDLYDIITDEEKRKRLVMYINPPYAEAGNARLPAGTGANKTGVSNSTSVVQKHRATLGLGIRELFAQFFARIYTELPGCRLGAFSKLKILQGDAFRKFRAFFRAHLEAGFIVPASTFDNVQGQFPIGFTVWNTDWKEIFTSKTLDVYSAEGDPVGPKTMHSHDGIRRVSEWVAGMLKAGSEEQGIGYTGNNGPDFQNNTYLQIVSCQKVNRNGAPSNATKYRISASTLMALAVYFAARKCIAMTWLNDRDQFLYPNDGWKSDPEFQSDCLTFTLFHNSNNIKSAEGVNHWIPFTESEVNAQRAFASHFMTDFMAGKIKPAAPKGQLTIGRTEEGQPSRIPAAPMVFSAEARAVFAAGRALWRYYHAQPSANPNASYYDIREHFQGRDGKGRMNARSDDAQYTALIAALRDAERALGDKIAPKVYEYCFLKE